MMLHFFYLKKKESEGRFPQCATIFHLGQLLRRAIGGAAVDYGSQNSRREKVDGYLQFVV